MSCRLLLELEVWRLRRRLATVAQGHADAVWRSTPPPQEVHVASAQYTPEEVEEPCRGRRSPGHRVHRIDAYPEREVERQCCG